MSSRDRDQLAIAAGLLFGAVADRAFADPRRGHPVALYGRVVGSFQSRSYSDTRLRGVLFNGVCVGAPVLAGVLGQRVTRGKPLLRAVMVMAATWSVLGGTTLRREAAAMSDALLNGDLAAARARLPHLAGRDPSRLDAGGLARATVESVAENTSDAMVAPLVWGALAGIPGLLGYRAVNTLDAMVGYRTQRYLRFGWASARLDDLANLIPARITALLAVAAAPITGGSRSEAAAVWRRDARAHPSPNAGHCEAAMAGALGVQLGGRNVYGGVTEDRPVIGDLAAPAPSTEDIDRAARLSGAVGLAALVLTAAHVAARPIRRRVVRRLRDQDTSRLRGQDTSRLRGRAERGIRGQLNRPDLRQLEPWSKPVRNLGR